jgi:hypothetical protein
MAGPRRQLDRCARLGRDAAGPGAVRGRGAPALAPPRPGIAPPNPRGRPRGCCGWHGMQGGVRARPDLLGHCLGRRSTTSSAALLTSHAAGGLEMWCGRSGSATRRYDRRVRPLIGSRSRAATARVGRRLARNSGPLVRPASRRGSSWADPGLPEHPLHRAALAMKPRSPVRQVQVLNVQGQQLVGAGGGLIQQPP